MIHRNWLYFVMTSIVCFAGVFALAAAEPKTSPTVIPVPREGEASTAVFATIQCRMHSGRTGNQRLLLTGHVRD